MSSLPFRGERNTQGRACRPPRSSSAAESLLPPAPPAGSEASVHVDPFGAELPPSPGLHPGELFVAIASALTAVGGIGTAALQRAVPGGKSCRLRLLVSDGVQTHRFESKPFARKARGWVALLLAPADGSQAAAGAEIELVGQGFETERRAAEFDKLQWVSSIDGELGSGHRRRVRLSPGKHQITLSVAGKASSSVLLRVG